MSTSQLEKFQDEVVIPEGITVTQKKHMLTFVGPLGKTHKSFRLIPVDVKIVENADDEILALNDFDASSIAVIDKRFQSFLGEFSEDSSSNIKLDEYQPNYLRYSSVSTKNQIAVFSEVYYDKGWNSYIDGELVSHFRANYILRAMNIPKGNHTIEFRFEPEIFKIGERISLASSILLIISLIFVSVRELKLR